MANNNSSSIDTMTVLWKILGLSETPDAVGIWQGGSVGHEGRKEKDEGDGAASEERKGIRWD